MGAVINLRPDLYRGVIADVPFVDIVSTMSDPSLTLTVTEWEERGDPRAEPFAEIAGHPEAGIVWLVQRQAHHHSFVVHHLLHVLAEMPNGRFGYETAS